MKMINKETECSRCSKDYRQKYGCKLSSSSTVSGYIDVKSVVVKKSILKIFLMLLKRILRNQVGILICL